MTVEPTFSEPVISLGSVPNYWYWHTQIRKGLVPDAVKYANRWWIPVRVVEAAGDVEE